MSRRSGRSVSLVTVGVLGVITAGLLTVFVLRLARSPGAKVQLGTDTFDVGRATGLVKPIAQSGPLLFQALRGSELQLYVQHLGGDPGHGWLALRAHCPDRTDRAPANCLLQWQPAARSFFDSFHRTSYPADGLGLDQYAVSVDRSGHVIVDLHHLTGTTPKPT